MRAEGSNAISPEVSNYLKRKNKITTTRTFPDLLISRSYYLLLMNQLIMAPYHIQSKNLILLLVDKEQEKKVLLIGKKEVCCLKSHRTFATRWKIEFTAGD